VDLCNPDELRLQAEEAALSDYLEELAAAKNVAISVERLVRTEPVTFDSTVVGMIEGAALKRGLATQRMASGASHEAQMIARIAPSAMIFVPSIGRISHNPCKHTPDARPHRRRHDIARSCHPHRRSVRRLNPRKARFGRARTDVAAWERT
jgi:N-carbamoyl-L-amino-acid hydrolase